MDWPCCTFPLNESEGTEALKMTKQQQQQHKKYHKPSPWYDVWTSLI